MTERDTRDAMALAFVTLATLVPVALLGVIAYVGTFTPPSGVEILTFAIPAALLGAAVVAGAGLLRH